MKVARAKQGHFRYTAGTLYVGFGETSGSSHVDYKKTAGTLQVNWYHEFLVHLRLLSFVHCNEETKQGVCPTHDKNTKALNSLFLTVHPILVKIS